MNGKQSLGICRSCGLEKKTGLAGGERRGRGVAKKEGEREKGERTNRELKCFSHVRNPVFFA